MLAVSFSRSQLVYFVAVAEEGQMTRAARTLNLAQPALSQAIARLEADLGVTLLRRHARGVSLTETGEVFLEKARAALAAWTDAVLTAQSLAEAGRGAIEFGFVGSPPGLDSPAPLEAFARRHPGIDVCFRELQFPHSRTSEWMRDVDIAVCHRPPRDAAVWAIVLRREPRVLLMRSRHRLAGAGRLPVEAVLDERFIGLDARVDPGWAGFWSLDDVRGSPPRRSTGDGAKGPQEVLAAVSLREAVTTVPASVAALLMAVVPDIAAATLDGGDPAEIVLCGHEDHRNTCVGALVAFARESPALSPYTPRSPQA
ncbi:MAG TPA: LysR family transcriptional regulator [Solirubrobacteraceae bacterium]|nr:LysR family transcriptional regulator [Solirubrobacteraceae bacterium]